MSVPACCDNSEKTHASVAPSASAPAIGGVRRDSSGGGATSGGITLVDPDDYEETGTHVDEYHRLMRSMSDRSLAYLQMLQAGEFPYQYMDKDGGAQQQSVSSSWKHSR